MRVITWKVLKQFGEQKQYADAMAPLKAWRAVMEKSEFKNPSELKEVFRHNVSIINNRRTVFDVAGNKYRLIVDVRYDLQRVYVRGVMTHEDYDEVDVEEL